MPRISRHLLALLALVGTATLAGGAHADSPDWRAVLGQTADEGLVASAADHKRRVPPALAPLVAPPLTQAEVDALGADADTRYPDGDRPLDRAAADAIFAHDREVAVGIQALLNRGGGPGLVTAAADLLSSDRQMVQSMLRDVRLLAPGAKSLTQGDRAYAQALAAWERGEPVNAVAHFEQAADRALDALEALGVGYDPSADLDADGVPDILELRAGADPRVSDTDRDGLTDYFEILVSGLTHHPAKADTDGDGIGDASEDLDGDGLDALGEQTAGSNPNSPDTDGDGLSDGAEVLTHRTKPTDADTDRDGLDDGAEIRAGTDPLNPDTDGDGILDGADTTTQTVSEGDVSVAVTGVGDVSGRLEIASLAGDALLSGGPGQAGPAYDISLPGGEGFESARITIEYDPAEAGGDEADLRVFWFDEERGHWQPAADEQTVDTAANTVTATVDHLSVYAIFNVRNWNAMLTALAGECKPRSEGGGSGEIVFVDVAFVLDSSGSMSWNDPQGFRRTAAKSFVDVMLDEDRGAVVDFDSFARILQALTGDKALLKAAIDLINSSGGTNIGAGVSAGINALAPSTDPNRGKIMILLTDGQGGWNPNLIPLAVAARITIYTIGLGSGVNATLLQSIATQTGGLYFPVANASDLPDVFREIEEETGDTGQDTDGDGLTDCEEEKGVKDAAGFLTFTSDPRVADTDGDGLEDGDEVNLDDRFRSGDVWLYPVFSDPRLADTDGDGLDDAQEADAGTRARSNETDGDGLGDREELEIGTDPTVVDTDGDGYGDGFEDLNRAGGYDPLTFTEVLGFWDYVGHFLLGATCGDLFGICQRDTVAWLAGNIASGFALVGDIRDAIGSLFSGDLVGAGIAVFSAAPFVGDAASVVAKAVKFVRRVSRNAADALRLVLRSELPSWAKLKVLEDISPAAFRRLDDLGLGGDDMVRLARGGTDLRVLDNALTGAARAGGRTGFVTWQGGEATLRSLSGVAGGKGFKTIPNARGTTGYRFVDAWDPVTQVAREAKTGLADLTPFIRKQIDKDVLLRSRGGYNPEWHFFPSVRSETLGPTQALLGELRARGIPYVIHLP